MTQIPDECTYSEKCHNEPQYHVYSRVDGGDPSVWICRLCLNDINTERDGIHVFELTEVRRWMLEDPIFNPPEAAVEAYPDECQNCGAGADPFWVPRDYHERDPAERDAGICTECGKRFGTDDDGIEDGYIEGDELGEFADSTDTTK